MKKILFILLGMWMFFSSVSAQIQEPVTFSVVQKKVSDTELVVTFTGQIATGWHVYGTEIKDGGPTRTELTIEGLDGLEQKGDLQTLSPVRQAMDEMFGMEVSYIEGRAVFEQHFSILSPTYKIKGYLTYGACNDENCIPPTNVDFEFSSSVATPSEGGDGLVAGFPDVLEENHFHTAFSAFFWGLLAGFIALLTPCVWPIIPMTVSFFMKRGKNRRAAIRDASVYGISIVVIYVALGLIVTLLFGASALNRFSTNAFVNIFFFLLLLAFALSFFGAFELTLPGSWGDAVDSKAGKTTGFLSIFLMAFTLSLVSFSCTGPIIGLLLVQVSTSGNLLSPTMGMLGFSIALALPFTLFAMFPTWLKSVPRSGGWMNTIKVCLGFLELAFSFKFLSVADLAYGWHLLDREVFLCLWIILFALLGAYLMGWFRFPHDEEEYDDEGNVQPHRTGIVRFLLAYISFAFSLYMVPGLWGAPCKAVSAFAPPMSTQDFRLGQADTQTHFTDYDQGMAYAREKGMPAMLDFTGYGCVNCRKMEAAVWTDKQVSDLMNNEYVLITLYVDDKTPLAAPMEVTENGTRRRLRTVGDKWSYLQRSKFGANAQPYYVLLDNEGNPLVPARSYDEDVNAYQEFLRSGLEAYKTRR